eukprot:21947_1
MYVLLQVESYPHYFLTIFLFLFLFLLLSNHHTAKPNYGHLKWVINIKMGGIISSIIFRLYWNFFVTPAGGTDKTIIFRGNYMVQLFIHFIRIFPCECKDLTKTYIYKLINIWTGTICILMSCNKYAHYKCKICVVLLLLQPVTAYRNYTAIQGSTNMTRPDRGLIAAYDEDTDTILILGGVDNQKQLVTFKNNTFSDKGETYLSYDVFNLAQGYTQIGHILWLSYYFDGGLFTMDTRTRVVTDLSMSPPFVGRSQCLSSLDNGIHQYLFVLGGY